MLVIYRVCNEERLKFELGSNGILMHTMHNVCVKPLGPAIDGVKVSLHYGRMENEKECTFE